MAYPIGRSTVASGSVLAALVLSALFGATQADAATIHACANKKSGAVRVLSGKAKCKKSETSLSWNSGGPAGKNGLNGNNGLNGVNGTNGTNGQDLTSHTPLPSGQSESGFFAAGSGSSTSGYNADGISFSQPLSAPIVPGNVVYNTKGVTSAHCPGFGHANPGYVCMYESESASMAFFLTRDFALNENAADIYGFDAFFTISATSGYIAGSWTVTAL
jgi:hypothetical protein